jgi:hypothetical protein
MTLDEFRDRADRITNLLASVVSDCTPVMHDMGDPTMTHITATNALITHIRFMKDVRDELRRLHGELHGPEAYVNKMEAAEAAAAEA